MKIAFIGAGRVGAPIALHLAQAGHDVVLAATKESSTSLDAALARSSRLRAQALPEAVRAAEVVFLTTPFPANEAVLRPIAALLAGKVLVDCTNPVGPGLSHGLRSERAGSELVQSRAPVWGALTALAQIALDADQPTRVALRVTTQPHRTPSRRHAFVRVRRLLSSPRACDCRGARDRRAPSRHHQHRIEHETAALPARPRCPRYRLLDL